MSPNMRIRGGKIVPVDNIYTALIGLALAVVLATAGLVAYMCYFQYGTFYQIP
jgi:hypothetical protein